MWKALFCGNFLTLKKKFGNIPQHHLTWICQVPAHFCVVALCTMKIDNFRRGPQTWSRPKNRRQTQNEENFTKEDTSKDNTSVDIDTVRIILAYVMNASLVVVVSEDIQENNSVLLPSVLLTMSHYTNLIHKQRFIIYTI